MATAAVPHRIPDVLNDIIVSAYEDVTPPPAPEPEPEPEEPTEAPAPDENDDEDEDEDEEEQKEEAKQRQEDESKDGDQGTGAGDDEVQTSFMRDGVGRLALAGGQSYEGDIAGGRMHGRGRYTWADGTVYEGTFKHGAVTGEGRYSWPDGSSYEGGVRDAKRHGTGVFRCGGDCASWYEGEWADGQRQGQGILYYDEKKTVWYKGQWHANLRHGRGAMRYASGNMYDGQWRANLKHGAGSMVWREKHERYRGQWADDKPNGFGEHLWMKLHGAVPEPGDIKQNAQQAPQQAPPQAQRRTFAATGGAAATPVGSRGSSRTAARQTMAAPGSRGRSPSRQRNSNAAANTARGAGGSGGIRSTQRQLCNNYKGGFRDGKRHGIGKFFFSDGAIYDGEWRDDCKHGSGTYTFADGSVYEGGFAQDRMLGPRPRPGQEEKRANPREVHWSVDDLLEPVASAVVDRAAAERAAEGGSPSRPAQRRAAVRRLVALEANALNSVVLRHISRIKDLYKRLAALSASDLAGMFTMTTAELLLFCRQCRLPPSLLPPAEVARLLRAMRRQHAVAVAKTRERRERRELAAAARERAAAAAAAEFDGAGEAEGSAATKLQAIQRGRKARAGAGGQGNGNQAEDQARDAGEGRDADVDGAAVVGEQAVQPASDGDIHDPGRPLLFREFVEALARLAYARYGSEPPRVPPRGDGGGDEGAAAVDLPVEEKPGSLAAARFERLWQEHIEPFGMQTAADPAFEALTSPEGLKALGPGEPAGAAIDAAFRAYAAPSAGGEGKDDGADVTISVALCWALLDDCLLIGSERPHTSVADVQAVFGAVFFGNADSNFADMADEAAHMDVTLPQFRELVVRLASRMYRDKEAPSLVDKAARLAAEFLGEAAAAVGAN